MENNHLKICVFKPIMWNSKNYKEPSGVQSTSGFSKDYGYGHEEWNNNVNWIWQGFKVFHTESNKKLIEYSKNGNLGIIMIATHNKKQYAVGIATNVFNNDTEYIDLIVNELDIYENYKTLWQQETVKKSFINKDTFLEHWKKNYKWIKWKCPKENYLWFDNPILLNPKKISGKEKLISMHGSYQKVLPQKILEILHNHLSEKPKIVEWLTNGIFDTSWVDENIKIKSNNKLQKKYSNKGKNSPTSNSFSYWIEGKRNIEPLHAKLQSQFVKYLSEKGIEYIENENYIDVQYKHNGNSYLCEIKPTENVKSKYAIRIAIGQLLEYQFFHEKNAILEIVLNSKPKKEELNFLKSLNIILTYFDNIKNKFITIK